LDNTDNGAVIYSIQANGLLHAWNRNQMSDPLRPGLIITEVNGHTITAEIIEELGRNGELNVSILRQPSRPDSWKKAVLATSSQVSSIPSARTVTKHLVNGSAAHENPGINMFIMPSISAGDADVTECAICCESVDAHEKVVHLPCGHGFHMCCMMQWMREKKGCVCPLCRADVQ